MTKAQRYHRARLALIAELGGSCALCGRAGVPLEFHHTAPRTWIARKAARWVRLARYRREAALGEVVLACHRCSCVNHQPSTDAYDPIPN